MSYFILYTSRICKNKTGPGCETYNPHCSVTWCYMSPRLFWLAQSCEMAALENLIIWQNYITSSPFCFIFLGYNMGLVTVIIRMCYYASAHCNNLLGNQMEEFGRVWVYPEGSYVDLIITFEPITQYISNKCIIK